MQRARRWSDHERVPTSDAPALPGRRPRGPAPARLLHPCADLQPKPKVKVWDVSEQPGELLRAAAAHAYYQHGEEALAIDVYPRLRLHLQSVSGQECLAYGAAAL